MKDKIVLLGKERRKSARYMFNRPLRISLRKDLVDARVCNIARHGMFIMMSRPLSVGTVFTARVALIEPVLIKCVVRRVEPGRGVGVSITAPGTEGRNRLAAFLDTMSRE